MATNNFKYAQLQPFTLSGSGAIAGATSITLQSMLDIDGNVLTMSGTFGTKGFGTMEPGNGALEEQISFTGLTNNANGTVTLSGVSTVTFVYPYTETSGLAKTHAGSTAFIISNTAGFYNKVVSKDDDATITSTLTFTVPNYPQVDNSATMPTLQAQFATKAYVDATVIVGSPNASTSVQGLVQLPTQAQVDAGTATGSTGAAITPTPALLRSKLLSDYVADTGVADAYVITPAPAIAAYAVGQVFSFKAAQSNTTASTLNVNAKGAKAIKKGDGTIALQAGDIVAGQIILVEYDGTNFQMLNSSALILPAISSSVINEVVGTTDGINFAFMRPFNYQAFTGNGTWTKPTNLSGNEMVLVQIWGGGGSGGGITTATGTGGGGGGGSYMEGKFRASDLTSTVAVTVGAVKAGGNGAGAVGNNSSFAAFITAYGGGGGATGTGAQFGGGGGGAGVNSVGGTVTSTSGGAGGNPLGGASGQNDGQFGGAGGGTGGTGGNSVYGGGGGGARSNAGNNGGNSVFGGAGGGGGDTGGSSAGGTSVFGGAGGAGATGAGAGTAGTAPGGGGGGARGTGGTAAGGDGARGEVRVWVFY